MTTLNALTAPQPSADTKPLTLGDLLLAPGKPKTTPEFTGVIGSNPADNPASDAILGGGRRLLANAIVPRTPIVQRLNSWQNALTRPAAFQPRPGTVTGGVPPLVPRTTTTPSGGLFSPSTPLGATFAPGTRMRTAPDLPAMSGQLPATIENIANSQMAKHDWAGKFARLNSEQQEVARSYLSAAVNALEQPVWSSAYITPDEFGTLLGGILDTARQPLPQPAPGALTPTTLQPMPGPNTPSMPQPLARSMPEPTLRPMPNPASQPSSQPSTTGSAAPLTPPSRQTTAALPDYPSLGPNDPKPAWWDAAVNGDRVMAERLQRLVLDSRDFLNQAESIALTTEQRAAWNTWKAA
jgi:hypothetical protein